MTQTALAPAAGQLGGQRVEPLVPEAAEAVQPRVHFPQRPESTA